MTGIQAEAALCAIESKERDSKAPFMGTGLGISNDFNSDRATITISSGRLYVMLSKD